MSASPENLPIEEELWKIREDHQALRAELAACRAEDGKLHAENAELRATVATMRREVLRDEAVFTAHLGDCLILARNLSTARRLAGLVAAATLSMGRTILTSDIDDHNGLADLVERLERLLKDAETDVPD